MVNNGIVYWFLRLYGRFCVKYSEHASLLFGTLINYIGSMKQTTNSRFVVLIGTTSMKILILLTSRLVRYEICCGISRPPRVKNFMWRLCKDCVPTRRRLLDKGINCPSNCVYCRDGEENNYHLFLQCPKSIDCRKKWVFGLCCSKLVTLRQVLPGGVNR